MSAMSAGLTAPLAWPQLLFNEWYALTTTPSKVPWTSAKPQLEALLQLAGKLLHMENATSQKCACCAVMCAKSLDTSDKAVCCM